MNTSQEIRSTVRGLRMLGRSLLVLVLVAAITALAALAVRPVHAQKINEDLKEALEYQHEGRYRDAVEIYTEVLEKNPSVVEALNWRAMAYIDLHELDKALADLDKAIKLSPQYPDAYNNRGEVYRQKKMFRKAMDDYRKAVQLNKNFAEPHYNMALVLENEKNYNAAIKEYQRYLQLQAKAEDRQQIETRIDSLKKQAQSMKPAPPPRGKTPAVKPATPPPPERQARPARPGTTQHPKPFTAPKPPEMPGVGGMPIPPGVMAMVMGLGMVAMILPLVFYIFFAVMLFLIAKKTGTDLPWLAFIPIANVYLMIRISGKPIWWFAVLVVASILSFVAGPFVAFDPTGGYIVTAVMILCGLATLIIWLLVCLGISAARGKSAVWGILLFIPCTNPIALAYLGLSR